MGLSRNKVAVSEGAAGSPPFYGETMRSVKLKHQKLIGRTDEKSSLLNENKTKNKKEKKKSSKALKSLCCLVLKIQFKK